MATSLGNTKIAAFSVTQAFSHKPHPVQTSECTIGFKNACFPVLSFFVY